MSVIRDLTVDRDGWCAKGKFDSVSLFQEEMKLYIFVDDGASEEDAVRCIEHYNSLLTKPDICKQIQAGLEKFFLYMYDEWCDLSDIYEDIRDSLDPVMEGYKAGTPLITYLYKPTLYVFPQLENEIGYGIECECPWEPEHQCSILIRNDKVVYVGPSEGNDPWGDERDYYCIWNDANRMKGTDIDNAPQTMNISTPVTGSDQTVEETHVSSERKGFFSRVKQFMENILNK